MITKRFFGFFMFICDFRGKIGFLRILTKKAKKGYFWPKKGHF